MSEKICWVNSEQGDNPPHRERNPTEIHLCCEFDGGLLRERTLQINPPYALFATLDTKVRTLHPKTVPKILLCDTVGFIIIYPTV